MATEFRAIFDSLLENAPFGVYIVDSQFRMSHANAFTRKTMAGIQPLIGRDFAEILHIIWPEPFATDAIGRFRHTLGTGEEYRAPKFTEHRRDIPETESYDWKIERVTLPDGQFGVICYFYDITELKQIEMLLDAQKRSLELVAGGAKLRETLEFLVRVVEVQSNQTAIASVLLLDDEGRLRVGAGPSLPCDYNTAIDGIMAREDLGTCSVAAVTGKVVVTPDIDVDPKWKCIKHLPLGLGLKSAWSQPIFSREGKVLGTLGTYFKESRCPTAFERKVVEILARTAGIAIERQRADDERERLLASERESRAEADTANREKDKFLAVLSHELRTPLSPVAMTIPAMELDPEMPARFREDLGMVRRNIELEVKLIDDLLDLSRVVSGKLSLKIQRVEVHPLLADAIRTSQSEVSGKRLNVTSKFDAANDAVMADPARLLQVFWNLLRNAMKFTPDGGEIVIRTSNDKAGQLHVEVTDNGVGIDPAILPRVFEAFEQGESRMHGKFGGLGLGLAIAKAVIEMHGATICAASQGRGCGATFTIRMAALTTESWGNTPARTETGAEAPASPGARVLLVEDHPDTARTLARLLKLGGLDVKTAGSAAAALQLAASETFDIIVSDIGLPDATGYELMRAVSQRFGLKGIALSGYGMEEDLRKSREAGFADHVVKPVSVAQLRAVIDRVARE